MHDPMTQAFQIPWRYSTRTIGNKPWRYWEPLITIWHVDPCKDGTDDSCGWFMRSRHGDEKTLEKIVRRFDHEWTRQFKLSDETTAELGLFDASPYGWPVMSMHGIALNLFFYAAYEMFGDRDRAMRFMRDNLCEILMFAENPTDSMHTGFLHKFGLIERETKENRVRSAAVMIYGWILRASRPWYKHPRWHIWHWRIQIHPLQAFKRWAFSRCQKCGKGFSWGYSPVSTQWEGTGPLWFRSEKYIEHSDCHNPSSECMAQTSQKESA